jgi:hypothetical protein
MHHQNQKKRLEDPFEKTFLNNLKSFKETKIDDIKIDDIC